MLDALATCTTVALDKTGTLTTGALSCTGMSSPGDSAAASETQARHGTGVQVAHSPTCQERKFYYYASDLQGLQIPSKVYYLHLRHTCHGQS